MSRILFALTVFCLLIFPAAAHEHTQAVPEIDRKFLDTLDRPDAAKYGWEGKSKSCCTDKDATKVEYKMIIPEGAKYPEPEWYVFIDQWTPEGKLEKKWVQVPPEKIVEEHSPSGQAYVYLIAHTIQCFVRPQTRY